MTYFQEISYSFFYDKTTFIYVHNAFDILCIKRGPS
jgi:hypothetical protein